ncbi:MAG: DUF433 domain-containing protein [Pseudomonadota bacterium]
MPFGFAAYKLSPIRDHLSDMIMRTFTPAEVAVLTGAPVKAVQKAIDSASVEPRVKVRGGRRRRALSWTDVLCVKVDIGLARTVPLRSRRALIRALSKSPGNRSLRTGPLLVVDLARARSELAGALKGLERARSLVVADPEVMGGEPVIRGTRIPVYLVAAMRGAGAAADEIVRGYPGLDREMVELAWLYAKAYPRRGRPPKMPWRARKPRRVGRARKHG